MNKRMIAVFMLIGVLVSGLAMLVNAQSITPAGDPEDPFVNITFPPPVYVLSGNIEIIGSADAIDMSSYFIEYRPLLLDVDGNFINTDDDPAENPWQPAAYPVVGAVSDGILGIWDTTRVDDGLYEIRLTVNITDSDPQFYEVRPLRVENGTDDSESDTADTSAPVTQPDRNATLQPTPTPPDGVPVRPTLRPSPTGLDRSATVIAIMDANVRYGDNTGYSRVGALFAGETAEVLGISASGNGWYYIRLPEGREGFIAPSTVRFQGDPASLTPIGPPPPITPRATSTLIPTPTPSFTPTPTLTETPIATDTPQPSGNLRVVSVVLSPAQPTCGQGFDIIVTIENNGSGATNSSGGISVSDRHVDSGTTTASTSGGFPVLGAGETFEAYMALTVDTYVNEEHDLLVTVDSGNQVSETNEGDNSSGVRYTLGC